MGRHRPARNNPQQAASTPPRSERRPLRARHRRHRLRQREGPVQLRRPQPDGLPGEAPSSASGRRPATRSRCSVPGNRETPLFTNWPQGQAVANSSGESHGDACCVNNSKSAERARYAFNEGTRGSTCRPRRGAIPNVGTYTPYGLGTTAIAGAEQRRGPFFFPPPPPPRPSDGSADRASATGTRRCSAASGSVVHPVRGGVADVGIAPLGGQHVEPRVPLVERVPRARRARRLGVVRAAVRLHLVLAARDGPPAPVASS